MDTLKAHRMIPKTTMKPYSDNWRNEMMRLSKSELVAMMERVMNERDAPASEEALEATKLP